MGIDLSTVKGTGPNDRILKADVEEAAKAPKPKVQPVMEAETVKVEQMGMSLAERQTFSKQNIPHYYVTSSVAVDTMINLRAKMNTVTKTKITVNDMVIKAAAMACVRVPEANSTWMGEFIRKYKNVNVGVTVQTDKGLVTPVIKEANHKGLEQIARELQDLTKKAKENKLKPEELEGATFSISNLGNFGVSNFQAIVNPGQACILSVGAAEKRVLVNETSKDPKTMFK